MSKILIAGGAGFIGSNLSKRLVADGHDVLALDNLLTSTSENVKELDENPQFTLFEHDVTNPIPEEFTAEYVFHLASPASPNFHSNISYHALAMETMMVNTTGTLNLLNFAQNNNARFLFASTSEVYGDPKEHPQKEEYRGNVSTTGPRSIYDEAKRFGETLTAYFLRDRDVDTRIARIFNTFGPNMHRDDMRMIMQFIMQAVKNEPITVFGDGTQTRSLCYIDDLVEGLVRLMFYDNTKGAIVNLGNPEEHTVLEYAQMVKKLTGSESEIVHSEDLPQDDPLRRCPDITRAKEMLSWEPQVSLEDGLNSMIAYIKELNN